MKKPLTIPQWEILKISLIKSFDLYIGARDLSVKPLHEGCWMVTEMNDGKPLEDGFAVVSNNLNEAIEAGIEYIMMSDDYDFMVEGEHPLLDAAIEEGWRIGFDPNGEAGPLHLVHDRLDRLWPVNDPAGALADLGLDPSEFMKEPGGDNRPEF